MPTCAIRESDNDGPWVPCPQPVLFVDPDGEPLCAKHLAMIWECQRCGFFLVAGTAPVTGDGPLCAPCQAQSDAWDAEYRRRLAAGEDPRDFFDTQ